jgi:hypothetical protein
LDNSTDVAELCVSEETGGVSTSAWATVLSPDASRVFVDREHLALLAHRVLLDRPVESRNHNHAARGADDHLSIRKGVKPVA